MSVDDEQTLARLIVAGHTDRHIVDQLLVSMRMLYRCWNAPGPV